MFEQLSKILVSDILVKLFKSYPQLKPISSAIADEVVNKVIIGNTNPLSVQYSIEDIQKSLSSPEPSLSQLGLQNVLSRSFLNRIDGTPLDDFILGTLGDDLIFAQEGDDIVIGLAGNDIVFAEDGDDIIFGGPISPGVPDNDLLFGGNGDDTFYGGEGDDVMLGGPGKDTVDYRFLNQGITLEAIGLIDKGNAGVDQIFEVETIIGNALQINSIDASTGNGNALIEVDLSSEILSVVGTPVGNFLFKIKNFSNVTGSNNQDTIIGNKANNKLLAEGGNDFIGGSAGDDIIDGGFGFDTIDYQNLGQAITLEAAGKVDKGFLGKDLLNNVERIVADGTKTNEIDGSTGTGTASLKVDLANNDLTVVGTPIGNLKLTVENFSNVTGTTNKDSIIGDKANNKLLAEGGNDFIGGSAGDDIIDGGFGFDTIDYQNLGQAITLEAAGKVDKGLLGKDLLNNVERIVADGTKTNEIDGSTGTGTASLKVDLANNDLTVVGTPIGNLKLTVENFVDVIGTNKDDVIVGNKSANNISGGKGDDELSGLAGKDTINGVDPTQKFAGFGEVDILTGGADQDLFILGDKKQAYYVGNGSKDLAIITDFQTGFDAIQLNGSLLDYLFLGTTSSTSILRRSSIVLDEIANTDSLTKPPISFDLISTVASSLNTTTDLIFV